MTGHRCPAKTDRFECWLIKHPGKATHLDYSTGWPQPFAIPEPPMVWRNKPHAEDVLKDAPEALKMLKLDPDDDVYDEKREGDDFDRP